MQRILLLVFLQKFKGTFFRDRRHGKGSYTWSDGSSFVGCFYTDQREGYGKFTYANGNTFEVSHLL